MARTDDIHEWWAEALLNQQVSAHPIFGTDIHVSIERDVITLTGEVESVEQAEEIEQEAHRIARDRVVVNHLTVGESYGPYHLQTIIAIFPDQTAAELAQQAACAWKTQADSEPRLLRNDDDARHTLRDLGSAAQVPEASLQRYLNALEAGKVLLIDRVPEDDAFRVISSLEGGAAESIQTLPPEPGTRA